MSRLLDPTSNEKKFAKIYSAAIIGATTPTTTRLWVRAHQPGQWTLVVTRAPLTGDLARLQEKPVANFLQDTGIAPAFIGTAHITYDTGLTHVFDVTGLTPETRYH